MLDSPLPMGLGFQDTATLIASGIQYMHDKILYYLIIVLYLQVWLMLSIVSNFKSASNFKIIRRIVVKGCIHGKVIELLWTISPGLILLLIAIPTYKLLYIMDYIIDQVVTVKGIGRQWYWVYELELDLELDLDALPILDNCDTCDNYDNYDNCDTNDNDNDSIRISTVSSIESYGLIDNELAYGGQYLANVDIPLVLPIDNVIRLLTTSGDVIHSLALPSLGIKGDGIPGRLNGHSILINRSGTYFGQCSELCGVNHAFI